MSKLLRTTWLVAPGFLGTLLVSTASLNAAAIQTVTEDIQAQENTQGQTVTNHTLVAASSEVAVTPEVPVVSSTSPVLTTSITALEQPKLSRDASTQTPVTSVANRAVTLASASSLKSKTTGENPDNALTQTHQSSRKEPAQEIAPTPSMAGEAIAQVTSVSQLSDVQPTDWAFQALQSLVERYGCIAGYPDSTYRGNRAMTRYEFAAGLNACLDRVNELIATGTANLVTKEDLSTLQRLQEEFAAELATLRGRVDTLEARTAELEANQFSTTTKLVGEGIFSVNALFASEEFANTVGSENNTVLQDRVRLDLQTSFTGRDLLHTRLAAGNFLGFNTPASLLPFVTQGTAEGNLSISDANTNNGIRLDRLDYSFPLGQRLQAYVAAAGGRSSYYVPSTVNPYFEDFDGGSGSISIFSQESPIYRIGGGAGAALSFAFDPNQRFVLTAGYLADEAGNPNPGSGLFNGDYAALGQLTLRPSDSLQLGLTYVHGYHSVGNSIFDLGFGNNFFVTGTVPANSLHTGLSLATGRGITAVTNSYGAEASFRLSPKFVINAFGGYTNLNLINTARGDIWYYGLGLAFPDLLKPGNLGGIMVGVEPYLAGLTEGINLGDLNLRNNTSLHVEGFYKYQVTDNISITPGVIWITNPDQDSRYDDYVIGTIRTTFTF